MYVHFKGPYQPPSQLIGHCLKNRMSILQHTSLKLPPFDRKCLIRSKCNFPRGKALYTRTPPNECRCVIIGYYSYFFYIHGHSPWSS